MKKNVLVSGHKDGQRWIAGYAPMKQNICVYVDTRSGEGIEKILGYLKDFIRYQAAHMTLPSSTTDDIIQELNLIALSAIQNYNINRGANMLTFLQNHLRNRIVNLYKFTTEQCRTATHENFRFCKIKCPTCKQYSVIDECSTTLRHCLHCGFIKQPEAVWKRYPVPIGFISANEEFALQDGSITTIQEHCSYDDTMLLNGKKPFGSEDDVVNRISLFRSLSRLDPITKRILILFLEGHTMVDISRQIKLSTPCIKSKIQALRKNRSFIELFSKDG